VALFYYSGHGAADAAGTNYLIPVDAGSSEEGALWDQSLRLTEITRKLKAEAGDAVHFVVFDACRNVLKLRKAGSRALFQARGYAPMAQESGMLIAYATADGETASDGGAYATALAEEIVKPGIEAVSMFRAVQLRVRAKIGQEPWIGFSALGKVHLAGLAPDLPTVAPADKLEWNRATAANRLDAYRAYVKAFPAGEFLQQALSHIAALEQLAARWDGLKASKDLPMLRSFAEEARTSEFGPLAALRLKQLEAIEAAAWKDAGEKQRLASYQAFLAAWPQGFFAVSARDKLAERESGGVAQGPGKAGHRQHQDAGG
jgi:uncharacterized caspase-like protein